MPGPSLPRRCRRSDSQEIRTLERGAQGKSHRADAYIVSAARHAYGPTVIVADEQSRNAGVPFAFLGVALRASLVIALSAAAIWFVLLPAINEKPAPVGSCKVAVTGDGTIRCASGAPLTSISTTPNS